MKLLTLSLIAMSLAACASKPVKQEPSEYVIGCATGMFMVAKMNNSVTEDNREGLTQLFAQICMSLEHSYRERTK